MKPEKAAKVVKVGQLMTDFSVPSFPSGQFNLSDFSGKKIVLYFYPKDDTPGCTIEGHDFTRLKDQFLKSNTLVFGVSRDSIKSHEKFSGKCGFKIDLLSDSEEVLCQLFDVIKEKNMYGKKVFGIERSTFVIDEDQKLLAEFRKVKAEGHAEEVLEFIKGLKS